MTPVRTRIERLDIVMLQDEAPALRPAELPRA